MDKKNKISFIPQKPISRKKHVSERPISLMVTVSFLLFFLTLGAFGGMFFYYNNIKKITAAKQLELSASKQRLDPDNAMERAAEFQKKINSIKKLLSSHIASSAIFSLLEDITLKSISFSSYNFSLSKDINRPNINNIKEASSNNKTPQTYSVDMKGVAPSYASLAYQSDVIKKEINKNKRISDFDISNILLNEKGDVSFKLKLYILPSFVAYNSVINQGNTPDMTTYKTDSVEVSTSTEVNLNKPSNMFNGN